jgi:hypothetical protein
MERSMDWIKWHEQYNDPDSALSRRLGAVRKRIAEALDRAPSGPIRVASMCAGDTCTALRLVQCRCGRDPPFGVGVLPTHPRGGDVSGRLVELNPQLVERARAQAPATIEVLCGDAGNSAAYEGAAPVDLLLCCGVFGNITDEDIQRTIGSWPRLCAPGATILWTRGAFDVDRRDTDRRKVVRRWVREAGFEELSFDGLNEKYGVGAAKMMRASEPYRRDVQFFRFVTKKQGKYRVPDS